MRRHAGITAWILVIISVTAGYFAVVSAAAQEGRRITPIDPGGGGGTPPQSALELHIFNVASGMELFEGDDVPLHVPLVVAVVGAWNQHDPKVVNITQELQVPFPITEQFQIYADGVGALGNVRVVAIFAEHMWAGGSTTQHGHDYISLTKTGQVSFTLIGAWNEDLSDFGFVETITLNAVNTWDTVEAWASQFPYTLSRDNTLD